MSKRTAAGENIKLAGAIAIVLALAVAGWFALKATILAPLVAIDLPIELAAGEHATTPSTVRIQMQADGRLTLGTRTVPPSELIAAIEAEHGAGRDLRIVLAASKDTAYADVKRIMDLLRQSGYAMVALATE